MRCRACGRAFEPHVFPGGTVRCACGAENETPHPLDAPAPYHPYREAAPHGPEPPPPPPPAQSRAIGPLCPRCTRLLREDSEHAALACDACHGLFVDHPSLAARVDAERPVRPSEAVPHAPSFSRHEREVRYAWCPLCGQVSNRMIFGQRSGIVVDVCREHGTWFDDGELDAVLAFVRGGGLEPDRAAAAPTAIDRVLEAKVMVAVLTETQQEMQHANDLAHLLLHSGHLGRVFDR
jgi:Zn-finger nucleic acid-binding protein